MTNRVSAPTRRASRGSWASTLFLPEHLPGIALEVADELAQIAVQLVARQQIADRALAGAQVGEDRTGAVEQRAGAAGGGRGAVERAVDAGEPLLGDEPGHARPVGEEGREGV